MIKMTIIHLDAQLMTPHKDTMCMIKRYTGYRTTRNKVWNSRNLDIIARILHHQKVSSIFEGVGMSFFGETGTFTHSREALRSAFISKGTLTLHFEELREQERSFEKDLGDTAVVRKIAHDVQTQYLQYHSTHSKLSHSLLSLAGMLLLHLITRSVRLGQICRVTCQLVDDESISRQALFCAES